MNTNNEEIIRKIKKLFALGDKTRGGTEDECNTAMGLAQELMAKHNIAMTAVQFDEDTQTLKGNIEEFKIAGDDVGSKWRRMLPHVVNILCNTKHYWSVGMSREHFLVFVGMKSDIEMAVEIYKELEHTIRHLRRGHKGNRQAFSYGVVMCLYDRIKEKRKVEIRPQNTNALMVIKDRAIAEFLASK